MHILTGLNGPMEILITIIIGSNEVRRKRNRGDSAENNYEWIRSEYIL